MEKEALSNLVGGDNISDDPGVLESFSHDHSFAPSRPPSLSVKPSGVEQVQELIRMAAETKTPLIPVSSGQPRFRGDTVPTLGGVMVDMSAMNTLRMIDRKERVAMVEPGVAFGELQSALKGEGLRLPLPLCPRANKSVVGSILEREPHMIPKYHLDHSDPMLCSEVTFGTGDVYRTGDADGPGTIEEQQAAGRFQKVGLGVQMSLTQIIQGAQGSFGIVTWATVRCEVLPERQESFLAASDHVGQLLEMAHRMIRFRLGEEISILNNVNLAHLVGKDEEDTRRLKDLFPEWVLMFRVAGYEYLPDQRIQYQKKDILEIAKNLGVPVHETLGGISAERIVTRSVNPSPEPYWKLRDGGGCQDIPFIASMAKVPDLVDRMKREAATSRFPLSSLGVYIQPVCQGHGHHCEFSLFHGAKDEAERKRARDLYLSSAGILMEKGAFFSRPYDLLAEKILNRDAASRDALRTLKAIFDPDNIMNPGKLCF